MLTETPNTNTTITQLKFLFQSQNGCIIDIVLLIAK